MDAANLVYCHSVPDGHLRSWSNRPALPADFGPWQRLCTGYESV